MIFPAFHLNNEVKTKRQMKNRYIFFLLIIFISFILFFQGCLKDDISPSAVTNNLAGNALLLNFLETNGNYINSEEMPSIIGLNDVYVNLQNFLIIDVRSKQDYSSGHISGAINVANDSLIEFINSKPNIQKYPKVIIVSRDGQASAYYTCLLRIYGLNNVFSLNFGMALWNRAFSDPWIENAKDHEIQYHLDGSRLSPESSNMKLPDIQVNQDNDKENSIKNLITSLINEGFNEQAYVTLSPPDTVGSADERTLKFNFNNEDISDFYIMCFGSVRLYNPLIMFPLPTGHLPVAVFYSGRDLQSSTYLQSLPPDKKIVVYSISGQESAFVTAYLRLLGYDAKSLLFGANTYTYSRLIYDIDFFNPYVFLPDNIRNLPYVSGSLPK